MARHGLRGFESALCVLFGVVNEIIQTLTRKHVSCAWFFEVIGLSPAGPPIQEIEHGDGQNDDTSNATDNAADYCANWGGLRSGGYG